MDVIYKLSLTQGGIPTHRKSNHHDIITALKSLIARIVTTIKNVLKKADTEPKPTTSERPQIFLRRARPPIRLNPPLQKTVPSALREAKDLNALTLAIRDRPSGQDVRTTIKIVAIRMAHVNPHTGRILGSINVNDPNQGTNSKKNVKYK